MYRQCCGAGAGTFWSEPQPEPVPVQRSGSGSTIDKTDEIINDTGILCISSHIDKRLFKKQIPYF